MPEITIRSTVQNKAVVTSAAPVTVSPPSFTPITTGWQVGNLFMKTLILRISGTISVTLGGGTLSVNQNGILRFIKGLIFGTDLHQNLVDNVDGLTLYRMLAVSAKQNGYEVDIAASTTSSGNFEALIKIPMFNPNALRAEDTVLDLNRAQPYIRGVWGDASDFGSISGGTSPVFAVSALNMEVSMSYIRGPFVTTKAGPNGSMQTVPNINAVKPNFMPYWFNQQVVINSTAKQFQIPGGLPYGDRIYKKLFIMQRDASTLAERSDIVGVNDQDRLTLSLNGINIVDNEEWLSIQHKNQNEYGNATIPAGMIVIDFDEPSNDGSGYGARLADALNLIEGGQLTFNLKIDVTNPGTGSPALFIAGDCVKAIPPAAQTTRAE